MAKWGFDENVPRLRPRVRLGRGAEVGETLMTEPPAPRDAGDLLPEDSPPTDLPTDLQADADSLTLDGIEALDADEARAAILAEPDLATAVLDELAAEAASDLDVEAGAIDAVLPEVMLERLPEIDASEDTLVDDAPARHLVVEPPAPVVEDPSVVEARRAALKRAAAGLSAIVETPVVATSPLSSPLDDLDTLADAAELAAELERALAEAAETNEALRKDLSVALDDLARTTADTRRLADRIGKLEGEAKERTRVVQELVRELELLEGERDGALLQAGSAALATERAEERIFAAERRAQELERQLLDARARTQRYEEAAAAQVAQRTALRAELEAVRRERDGLLASSARLERERDDFAKSRRALDEVHRALSEARSRAQRLRPTR